MKKLIKTILNEVYQDKFLDTLKRKFKPDEFYKLKIFLFELDFEYEDVIKIYRKLFSGSDDFTVENLLRCLVYLYDLFPEWGFYNCGLGECCDPTYIALSKEHQEEVFKLVDNRYLVRFYSGKRKHEYEDLPEICMEDPGEHIKDYEFLFIQDEDVLETLLHFFESEEVHEEVIKILNKKFGTELVDYETY